MNYVRNRTHIEEQACLISNLYYTVYTVFHTITYLCKKQFYVQRMWHKKKEKKKKHESRREVKAWWNIKAR